MARVLIDLGDDPRGWTVWHIGGFFNRLGLEMEVLYVESYPTGIWTGEYGGSRKGKRLVEATETLRLYNSCACFHSCFFSIELINGILHNIPIVRRARDLPTKDTSSRHVSS